MSREPTRYTYHSFVQPNGPAWTLCRVIAEDGGKRLVWMKEPVSPFLSPEYELATAPEGTDLLMEWWASTEINERHAAIYALFVNAVRHPLPERPAGMRARSRRSPNPGRRSTDRLVAELWAHIEGLAALAADTAEGQTDIAVALRKLAALDGDAAPVVDLDVARERAAQDRKDPDASSSPPANDSPPRKGRPCINCRERLSEDEDTAGHRICLKCARMAAESDGANR